MNTNKAMLRSVALITLCVFTCTQTVTAMPAAGIEINVESEAPGFLSVDIPSELATLDELYQAPPVSEPRLVLHIQNAHANYGAQQKVKELLKYLNKTYSIDTIFVEGASSELDPDRLKYFPDDERNRLLADQLAKDGRLTGAELFLLEDSYEVRGKEYGEKSGNTASVKAYGIENAELYRKNYEALRKVFGAEAVASRYVNELDARLETISSGISGNDLRRVIGEWKKFEKGQREFMPYIRSLAREANQTLKLDLESLFAQVEWPQIARLLVLQDIEKELSPARAAAEKEKLLGFLRSKSLPAELIRDIENLKDQNISVAGKNPANGAVSVQPRFLLEKLAGAAGPYDFRFSDYPAYSVHAGYLILRSELDSGALFAEIRRLFMQILEKLAASPAQRKLVELNRRTELIRKLLNLELARRDWQEIEAKKDAVAIDAMIRDFRALSDAVSTELRLAAPVLSGMDADPAFRSRIDSLYEAAYAFYAHAHEREAVFYEKIDAVMSARGERAAVLITGGFHTGGITDLFRDHDVSYGVLTPRLMEKSDEKAYRDNMLERGATVFDIANLEAFNIMQDDDVIRSQIGPEGLKAFQKYLTSTLVKILARHPQHLTRAIKAISERSFREHGIRWVEKRNGKDSVVVLEKVGKNEEDVEEITNITDKDGKVYALRFSPLENGKYAMRAALMDPVSVTPALAAQAPTAQTPVGSRAGARPESDQKQDVGTRPESRRDVEVNQASVQSGPMTLQVMNVRVGPWVLPAFASKFIRSVFDRLAMWGVGPNISEGAGYYRGVAGNYGIDLDDEIAKRVAALDGARPLRVLDLGAGTAGYLQRLKDRYGDRVEAIAVDSSYPEQKRTRRGVKMIGKDAPDAVREFRERGEEFDVVLSINANSAAREFLLGSGPVLLNSNSLVFVHGADFLNEDHISSLEKQGYSVANGGTVTRKTPHPAAAKQPGSRSEMRVPLPVPDELVLDEKPDFDAWMNRLGARGIRPAEPVIAITAKLFSARKVLPYRDFEQRLRDLEPKLIDALRNAGSYAVLLHKPHTSRRWVLSHLRVGAPDGVRAPGGLFYEGESEDHLKKASRFMTFVVVDDVAYSGRQIRETIEKVGRVNPGAKFIIVVPYMTNAAAKLIKQRPLLHPEPGIRMLPKNVTVNVLPFQKLPTISDVLPRGKKGEMGEIDVFELNKGLFGADLRVDGKPYDVANLSVVIPEWKIPDQFSLLQLLIPQRLVDQPFLPPYKDPRTEYYREEEKWFQGLKPRAERKEVRRTPESEIVGQAHEVTARQEARAERRTQPARGIREGLRSGEIAAETSSRFEQTISAAHRVWYEALEEVRRKANLADGRISRMRLEPTAENRVALERAVRELSAARREFELAERKLHEEVESARPGLGDRYRGYVADIEGTRLANLRVLTGQGYPGDKTDYFKDQLAQLQVGYSAAVPEDSLFRELNGKLVPESFDDDGLLLLKIPPAVGVHFNAHGMWHHANKPAALRALVDMLRKGLDPDRVIHEMPLAVMSPAEGEQGYGYGAGFGAVSPIDSSNGIMLISGPDATLNKGGIKCVIMSSYYKPVMTDLQAAFPGVRILSMEEAPGFLAGVLEQKGQIADSRKSEKGARAMDFLKTTHAAGVGGEAAEAIRNGTPAQQVAWIARLIVGAKDPQVAAAELIEFAITIGAKATVPLPEVFRSSNPDVTLPMGEGAGMVADVLDSIDPEDARIDAIKAVLALNPNQFYELVLFSDVNADAVRDAVRKWGAMNGLKNINERFGVSIVGAAGVKGAVRDVFDRFQNEAAKMVRGKPQAFVVTGLAEHLGDAGDTLPAAVVEVDGIDPEILKTAGAAAAVSFAQDLLRGDTLSQRTNEAINPKGGNRYQFRPEGLQALSSRIRSEIRALLSLSRAA